MAEKSFASDTRIGLSLWFWGCIVYKSILGIAFAFISMSIFVPGGFSVVMAMSEQEIELMDSTSILLPIIVIFFSAMLASFYVNRKYYINSRKIVTLTALGIEFVSGFLLISFTSYLLKEEEPFSIIDTLRQVIFFAVSYFSFMFFLQEEK